MSDYPNKSLVLCVEDDPVALGVVSAFVKSEGYEVRSAISFEEAILEFETNQPMIIICDWQLKDHDGLQFCKHVRAANTPYIYFILLTSFGGEKNAALAIDSCVDDFLTKPVKQNELSQRLKVAERIVNTVRAGQPPTHPYDHNSITECIYCKSIMEEIEGWQAVEEYIAKVTGKQINPDICTNCYDRVMRFNSPRSCLTTPPPA